MTNEHTSRLAGLLTANIDDATFNAHHRDADDLAGAIIDDGVEGIADDDSIDDDDYRAIELLIADPSSRDELREVIAAMIRTRF